MRVSSTKPIPWETTLTVIVSGMAVMSIEILASRLLAPAVGTSVLVWTNLIGVILVALALGAWFGGYLSDTYTDRKLLGWLLFGAGITSSFLPFTYSLAVWILTFLTESTAIPVLALVLLAPTAFVLGAVPPAAIRLTLHEIGDAGHIAGRLNAFGAVGSLVGTYVTGYVLIAVWPVHWILASVSLCLFMAGVLVIKPWSKKHLLGSFLGLGAIFAGQTADAPQGVFIPSQYSAMRVSEHQVPEGTLNILWMDNTRHGAAVTSSKSKSYLSYYQLFLDFTDIMNPEAKRFLSIGGGTFHGARLWIDSSTDRSAVSIERDPAAIQASKTYFGLTEDPRLEIITGDGRAALQDIDQRFDAVLIDAYADHLTIPWHLITEEAWQSLRTKLTDDAFVAMNFVIHRDQSLEANQKLISGTVNAAKASFRHVTIVNTGNKYSPTNLANTLLILSNRTEPTEAEIRTVLAKSGVLSEPVTYPLQTEAFPAFTDAYAPIEYLTAEIVQYEKRRARLGR